MVENNGNKFKRNLFFPRLQCGVLLNIYIIDMLVDITDMLGSWINVGLGVVFVDRTANGGD